MPVHARPFGALPDGQDVTQFVLTNSSGLEVRLLNYGGIITHLFAPDAKGQTADVVLGFDTLEPYLTDSPYFGAIIGRFGNRIAQGEFQLDDKTYRLEQNDGSNHLHGGLQGFDKKLWDAEPFEEGDDVGVRLTLISPDGDQGYPGELHVRVEYRLTPNNDFMMDYQATTTQPTPVNLTQHSYFNLAGQGTVLAHQLMLNAQTFTPVDEGLIPEGELESVTGTPFDFTRPKPIGEDIAENHPQLALAGGYDHNFVLAREDKSGEALAARALEPVSGRILEVWTEEPCFQLYTGNSLDASVKAKGQPLARYGGFCIEPQHFPDSPNQGRFPSTVLRPGERYHTRMSFRFRSQ